MIKARNVFLSGKATPLWIAPTIQLPGVHNQPAKAGRMPLEHRPSTVDNIRLGDFVVVMFLSNSYVSKSLVETPDQRKHRTVQLCTEAPKTIHLSTPLCKGYNFTTPTINTSQMLATRVSASQMLATKCLQRNVGKREPNARNQMLTTQRG